METSDFVFKGKTADPEEAEISYRSPSNIALIKYWGKKGDQLPANASLSFTLEKCASKTAVHFKKRNGSRQENRFFFEGKEQPGFGEKSFEFFRKIRGFAPFLGDYNITVRTENSFPHSSGIASSASGMSALALCIIEFENQLTGGALNKEYFYKKASFLARIGSGSASRSCYGKVVTWGEHAEINNSSDFYATPLPQDQIHPGYLNYRDVILLIHEGSKSVSSTAGHSALTGNPFAQVRFEQAQRNLSELLNVMSSDNYFAFSELVEREALTLHALMMTGKQPFILMKPQTLDVITKITRFRKEKEIPVCFTLDAGANVHVLFPESFQREVMNFIESDLVRYCENKKYICDLTGDGPQELSL